MIETELENSQKKVSFTNTDNVAFTEALLYCLQLWQNLQFAIIPRIEAEFRYTKL